jgi:ankyrin repeat protein
MEPSLKVWKQHFCEGAYTTCVRYQHSLQGKTVPITLLPNGKVLNKVRNKDEVAGSALFNAIYKGRVPMVKSMLKNKVASSAIVASDGMTPLMAAASTGNVELVELFLQFGCNPFNKRNDDRRAVDIANEVGHAECASVIQNYMDSNPELEATSGRVSQQETETKESEEKEAMKDVVSLLRKLNPFKKVG